MARSLHFAFSVLIATVLLSCKSADKEKASEYYQDFSSIILPYKQGTERILTETQTLLQNQLRSSGNLKLSREDSLKQRALLTEFETLVRETMANIHNLEEFPDSDLKSSAVEYVQSSASAVLGAFHQVAFPMQDTIKPPEQHAIDSLSEKFGDDLVNANDKFASSQMEFLEKFELSR